MIRQLIPAALLTGRLCATLTAGELYYTGFENFPPGNNTIAGTGSGGTDGWTGSVAHLTLNLSGIDTEADHLVAGIGNAAFIGGNPDVLGLAVSRTVSLRRPIDADPVALGQDVLQFRVNVGIKDSTDSGLNTRRDNFEFAFYNQDGQLTGFVQFDNSTLDSGTDSPVRTVLRSSYNTAVSRWDKASTGAVFYHGVLMELVVRINYRTNRWSALLDGVEVFYDEEFYSGPNARNLGVVAVQMQIVGTGLGTPGQIGPAPGDNYMLFDDFAVRIDPVPAVVITDFSRDAISGAVQLRWWSEALYRYQVQYSDNLTGWKSDLPGSNLTAANTGFSPVFTDLSAAGKAKRFYRVLRAMP
jgi:hypothetical protein